MARAFLITTVLLLLISSDLEYKNSFEAELPEAREKPVCKDPWQVSVKKTRQIADDAYAAFKPTD